MCYLSSDQFTHYRRPSATHCRTALVSHHLGEKASGYRESPARATSPASPRTGREPSGRPPHPQLDAPGRAGSSAEAEAAFRPLFGAAGVARADWPL